MRFNKKIFLPFMAALVLSMPLAASAQEALAGEASIYKMQDGSKVTVDRKAMAVYMKAKAKELGTPVNTLSNEEWDKVALDVSKLTPEELQELYSDLESGTSFENLTADEMAALQSSYDETTWDSSESSEEDSSAISDETRQTQGMYALAGLLGGTGLAAGAGYYSRRGGRGFSLYSGIFDSEPKDNQSASVLMQDTNGANGVSVLNTPWENMQMANFPDLTPAEAYSGWQNLDFSCNNWDGVSESTKQFASMVGAAWSKMHPELPNLLVTSGKREGGGDSHHDYGEAFDVANSYFDDKSLRNDYVNLISTLGGTPLDEWEGEPGAKWAHGDNIHATTPGSDWGGGGYFRISDWC